MATGKKFAIVIKGLILSYAVTGLLLLGLAFLVYRFRLGEQMTNLAIIGIYVLVTFLGGFVTGKKVREQKFLWGFLLGFLYILIILVFSMAVSHTFQVPDTAGLSALALCIGGGLLGGMIS